MGKKSARDSIDTEHPVFFYETEPCRNAGFKYDPEGKKGLDPFSVEARKNIINKWLYVFWSKGEDYAVSIKNGPWEQRVSDLYARQHMAKPGLKDRNPPRTATPREHAEKIKYEIYFDDEGFAYRRDISKEAFKLRHERKHPKIAFQKKHKDRWKQQRESGLSLPLTTPNGDNIRYYFLLSSIRLGPEALGAAIEEGAADGLSIWAPKVLNKTDGRFYPPKGKLKGMTPKYATELQKSIIGPGSRIVSKRDAKWELFAIGVVDPYHFAGDIMDNLYQRALDDFLKVFNSVNSGGYGANSAMKPHLNYRNNRGSIYELYFIAMTLTAVRKSYKDKGESVPKWDGESARRVIRFVESKLKKLKNACEARANFLTNWLASPAHRLIDIGISKDTVEQKKGMMAEDREVAADDRAYGLAHWHNMTTLLGFTTTGTVFLASANDVCPHNPIKEILMPYATKKLESKSVDEAAFEKIKVLVPDLVINDILTRFQKSQGSSLKDLSRRTQKIADLMNNLHFFSWALSTKAPRHLENIDGITFKKAQPYIDNGTWLWEQAGVLGEKKVDGLFERVRSGTVSTRVEKMLKVIDERRPTLGTKMQIVMKAPSKTLVVVPYVKLFTGAVALIQMGGDSAATLVDKDKSAWKKLEAGAELSMGVMGLFEGIMAIKGVKPLEFRQLLNLKRGWVLPKYHMAYVSSGMLSVCGLLSAGWIIYSNMKSMRQGWDRRDTSTAVGSGIAVIGGVLLLGTGVGAIIGAGAGMFAAGPVGWIAGACVILGGIIIWLGTDDDFEVFTNSSYFAHDPDSRNIRKFGDKDDWAGPKTSFWKLGPKERNWPVMDQAVALTNLVSRYTVRSTASARIYNEGPGIVFVESFDVYVNLPNLLPGTELEILITDTMGRTKKKYGEIVYKNSRTNLQHSDKNSWKVTDDLIPGNGKKSDTIHIGVIGAKIVCGGLQAKITYKQGSAQIGHTHRIAEWDQECEPLTQIPGEMICSDLVVSTPKEASGPANQFKVKLPSLTAS